jgi:hypothetical protein
VVLIEDRKDEDAVTALGQRTLDCQGAFAKFLTGLFHWKLDTSDSRTYSLKPEDYPTLPLFKADPEKCVLLNQVFWLVLDDAFSWRSMSRLSCNTVEEVEHLAESQYLSIAASRSGAALPAIPKISKHLVAYMEGLVAVSPYKDGTFDDRATGVAEHAYTQAFNNLNKIKNEPYMIYLKRKLGEWYREAPKPLRREPVADEEEEPGAGAAATGGGEEEQEAGGDAGGENGGFLLD